MKLFRLRFILLGLLLCLYHVWCLTCGTEFDDVTSNAYLAHIVIIGQFSNTSLPSVNNLFNYTLSVSKSRDIIKGEDVLRTLGLIPRRGPILLKVGVFGQKSPEYCSADIEQNVEYIFYLQNTTEKNYFRLSAMPVSELNSKAFKQAKKAVKKVTCKKDSCGVKLPEFDTRKMMNDLKIQEGKKLELNCKLKRKPVPNPVFTWLKDGEDINTLKNKGLRIKTNKKGSRLTIRKASKSDSGTYECIARNVGGEIKQLAVITVSPKEAEKPVMLDVAQKFRETLEITCKVQSNSKTRFKWLKDDREIKHGDKDGEFIIKSKSDESTLRKLNTLLSDAGVYTCQANGEIIHRHNVTVTDGPQKEKDCGKEDEDYCFNNGTCKIFVEINKKFCQCTRDYEGQRCETYNTGIIRRLEEDKLAQDRTFVIVGIISGILLFIGICVASYFLAKRRRDQFHRRRIERNGNIEDNIPQVYRPLIGCDEIDGLNKKMNGVLIHKGVQTIETCFLGPGTDKANLYINPLESYVKNEAGDRNSRSRKTAVSLEEDPRARKSQSNHNEPSDERRNEINNRKNNNCEKNNNDKKPGNEKANDGAPKELLNDLSPKPNPLQKEVEKTVGATPQVANIPSPKSSRPPQLDLESDSEEDIPGDGKPLTPLHISEDEDNSDRFKKFRPKTKEEEMAEFAEIFKKCRVKANVLKAFSPSKHTEEKLPPSNSNDKNLALVVHSPENNTAVSPSAEETVATDKASYASSSANDDSDSSSTTTEGCDSPNTAYINSLELSDTSPTPPRHWNERGSPEPIIQPPSYSSLSKPDNSSRHGHADKGPRFVGERNPRNDRRIDESRNKTTRGLFGANIKDKFSIHL